MDSVSPSVTPGRLVNQPSTTTAVRDLYECHYVRLVRLAVLFVGDAGRAEEIVQDAFVDLVARWQTIRDPGTAASYLRVCVANGARSHLRHRAVVNRQPVSQPSEVNSAETERWSRSSMNEPCRCCPNSPVVNERYSSCGITVSCPRPRSPTRWASAEVR